MTHETPNDWTFIAYHPELEKLREEVDALRAEISALVLERDNLLYQECKNIEMAYMLAVGALEYTAYETECAILRLKRKAELLQACKNRQEAIVISKIERMLDEEFAAYQEMLDEKIKKMNAALERSHGKKLSAEETREIKQLYHAIVKAIHPDLHPDLSDAKTQLFHTAVEAHGRGDLERLRIIAAMLSGPGLSPEKPGRFDVLMEERERLTRLTQGLRDEIAEIQSSYPYTMKALIQSPEKVEARKAEIATHIQQLNEIFAAYNAKVEEMLR